MPTQFSTNPATRFIIGTRRNDPAEASGNLSFNPDISQSENGNYWGQDGGSIDLRQLSFEVGGETILGAHYINIESRTDDVVMHQLKIATQFGDGSFNAGNRKIHQVSAGERYRVQATARGSLFEDLRVGVFKYDEDQNYLGFDPVVEFGWNAGVPHERIDTYIIPAGVAYIGWGAVSPADSNATQDLQFFTLYVRRLGEEESIIENGDFEDRLRFWHGNFSRIDLEETNPISGDRSLRIQALSGSTLLYAVSPDGRVDQADNPTAIPVEAGKRYAVRSTAIAQSDQDLVVRVQPVDENASLIGELPVTVNIHSGTNATARAGIYEVPDGVEYVILFAQVDPDPSERFYILDSVEFQQLPEYITERMDETKIIDGYWTSPQLNRHDRLVSRMVKLFLLYSTVEDTTVTVRLTRDGWKTESNPITVKLGRTGDSINQQIVHAQITGHDIRFQIDFDEKLVAFYGYSAELYAANELEGLGD